MLQNWWENNREVEAIATFMQQLSSNLQTEIDALAAEIADFKAGREMRTAEQEKELEDEVELRERVGELERSLKEVRSKNESEERELGEIEGVRRVVVSQILDMEQKRNFLNAEQLLLKDQESRIHGTTHRQSTEEAEYLHYVGMQALITHYLDRKQ